MKDWKKNLEEEDTRRLTKTWLASALCVPVDKTNSDLENLFKQFPLIILLSEYVDYCQTLVQIQ